MKVNGPSFRSAGKYGKLRIVDPKTGCLLLDKEKGFAILKATMRKGMLANGVARPEIEQFLELLDNDKALEKEKGADPVEEIVSLFNARRHQLRERMTRDIEVALQRRTAVERNAQAAVRAAEENMRAVEERLRAAEESTRAAEDRLRAAEESMRAAEQGMRDERDKRIAAEKELYGKPEHHALKQVMLSVSA
ncbi:hypothetical protein B0H14DRAFT_3429622 [Mycena olivaceomarginata]|nr:hypothetical protein B0H14DRAFT_3429622 [Mycena olivaceomarginata]